MNNDTNIAELSATRWQTQTKYTLFLAMPILFAHLVEGLLPFINTLFAAHIGQVSLAAAGLATAIFLALMGFCWGVVASVGIITANRIGAGDSRLGITLRSGLLLSFVLSIPLIVVFLNIEPFLLMLGQEAEISREAQRYFYGLAFAVPADIAKFAIFQFAIAVGKPRVPLIANILSVPLLVVLNMGLVWGKFGLPELGIMGIGIATAIVYWLVFLGMLFYVQYGRVFKAYWQESTSWVSYRSNLWEQLKLGAPIGGMFSIEIAFFAVLAILMGWMGTVELAAHQITMQWLWITIIVAYGFAEAITILVGKANGANNMFMARQYVRIGITISAASTFLVALVYWFSPHWVIGVDIKIHDPANQELIRITISFLAISAVFQLLDCMRIVSSGALRGMRDSQYPMWVAIVAFWFIGLPAAYLFAFVLQLGGVGLWYALVLAGLTSGFMQYGRLYKKLRNIK